MESPVIHKEKLLTFSQAIAELTIGKKITRKEWNDTESYGLLKDGLVMIHLKGNDHQWIINDGDLTAEDWIVL